MKNAALFTNSKNLQFYSEMFLIREAELRIANEFRKKTFQTPIHLAIGQEAISVGVAHNLKKTDAVFGNHRSHGHYLALGGELEKLFSEILGKANGCSGGKGGSMHIKSPENGLIGTMPIVSSTIPIAVGAALALKNRPSSNISVAFFGDGATEEGVFHESLNLASNLSLPILFVCENNQFSSHLHISERQSSADLSRFAAANDIIFKVVDGNSVSEVQKISAELIEIARTTRAPVFLEANTYRLFGHVGGEVDESIGLNRESELQIWQTRDPIVISRDWILANAETTEVNLQEIEAEIQEAVNAAWSRSISHESPDSKQLLEGVYFE
jgi:TPP-dependent pyruvate/acetoin dehydrogenase alpha subunit